MADQTWAGCVVPDDRLYDVGLNVWVQPDEDEVVLGMTDVAQTLCGRMVAVSWKRPGRQLTRGQTVAVVESAKWVGPFPTPLSGTLLEVNRQAFEDDVSIVNRDPYGAGWMAKLRPTDFDGEKHHLCDGAAAFVAYRQFIDAHDIHCYRCSG